MPYILGLDPSIKKTGYVVLDTNQHDDTTVERGLLKTSQDDGLLILRLIKQSKQVEDIIKKYNISFVGMEAPFMGSFNTEKLYALNQFLHKVFLDNDSYVVAFPPQELKKLVFPNLSVDEIHKPHMIDKAKTALGLHGQKLAEDTADAYWAGIFGKKYYKWHIEKSIGDQDLDEYVLEVFAGKHTFTRGPRKGVTEYKGIIYRENELFFDFKAIKRRAANAEKEILEGKKGRRSAKGSGQEAEDKD